MSAAGAPTSRHLSVLADHVQSGAHVVLRGHLGDDVLLGGEVREEIWAIGRVLAQEAGIEAVVVVNQADGVQCLDENHEPLVSRALQKEVEAEEQPQLGARLGAVAPLQVAGTVRALLRQEELAIALVVQDAFALGECRDSQERRALGMVVEAMAEANFTNDESPVRNALIVYGDPPSPLAQALVAVPGVVEQRVSTPDRAERLAALRCLAAGFYGAEQPAPESDLESLARITHGCSVRELEQLRRRSHRVRVPVTRPESLFRESRREPRGTLVDRVGVPTIMAMLEEEIVGQPRAMRAIEERLERGRWRSANRPPGSMPTRPMATMVLHGPPGVGKTETGYALADALAGSRDAVRRIDCTEFQDHDIARLTGAPPGYVGYEDGGILTEALESEVAIIVLDEFDRGPARLREVLLGILDAGRLTDGRGRTVTFQNAILILTTNAGTDTPPMPLPSTGDLLKQSAEALETKLETPEGEGGLGSPALWSRLQGALVGYDYLRRDALEALVAKSCRHLAANLGDEFDLRPRFAVARFVEAIGYRLPPDGEWDGRQFAPCVQALIELPAREQLEAASAAGAPPGAEIELAPATGRAAGLLEQATV